MSIIADRMRRLDGLLDRVPLLASTIAPEREGTEAGGDPSAAATAAARGEEEADDHDDELSDYSVVDAFSSPRATELLRILRALSTTTASGALLPAWRIEMLLSQSVITQPHPPEAEAEIEILWLILSKAAILTYGLILTTLLDQIIPLNDDIWYWDEVLGSYVNSALYAAQTSPLRLWAVARAVVRHLLRPGGGDGGDGRRRPRPGGAGMLATWRRFHAIVRDTVRDRSIATISIQRSAFFSPVALCRAEARAKQAQLKWLRQMTACGLGALVDSVLALDPGGDNTGPNAEYAKTEFERISYSKASVFMGIELMTVVLRNVLDPKLTVAGFEHLVVNAGSDVPSSSSSIHEVASCQPDRPDIPARNLLTILRSDLPAHVAAARRLVAQSGKPPRLVRYWLPIGLGFMSASTALRVLFRRRADVATWLGDLAGTARDFWIHWVVEPVRKIVGTIRHDANSEIALMSRDSLRADQESLERMVVDFAIDRPQFVVLSSAGEGPASPSPSSSIQALSDAQIAEVRAKVAEGDVTPVLRAFERDLRSPLVGAIRGDLARSLLIQVQKTKVDLEVAISGIDALLKSQELVFGFVGLTPGILVSAALVRYLGGLILPARRRERRHSRRAGQTVRVLRNIDRILAAQEKELTFREYGLVLCEVHVLRGLVRVGGLTPPREIERELLEDLDEICTTRRVREQRRALERIRWAYARWLQ